VPPSDIVKRAHVLTVELERLEAKFALAGDADAILLKAKSSRGKG
jgi:hypothetical protein